MATEPARFRPKAYPPPEFPPRKTAAFARTPPAIFPPILGLIGLGLGLKRALAAHDGPLGPADAALGVITALWVFAVLAYLAKLFRRPSVVTADLGTLPGRAGLAAASIGGMLLSAVLAPFSPAVATGLLGLSLLAHAVLAVLLARLLLSGPPESRSPNPTLHLSFVGFIVGGVGAAELGFAELATAILYATLPVAVAIWLWAGVDFLRRIPPVPLRPLLAIHLAPASLMASVAALTGHDLMAQGFATLAAMLMVALVVGARWLLAGGFSPMWGALTFPLAAASSAFVLAGWTPAGLAALALGLAVIPWIAWKVLSLWPGNRLAAKTNAAEA